MEASSTPEIILLAIDTQQRCGKGLGMPACQDDLLLKCTKSEQKIKPVLKSTSLVHTQYCEHCRAGSGKGTLETVTKDKFSVPVVSDSYGEFKPVTNAPHLLCLV